MSKVSQQTIIVSKLNLPIESMKKYLEQMRSHIKIIKEHIMAEINDIESYKISPLFSREVYFFEKLKSQNY